MRSLFIYNSNIEFRFREDSTSFELISKVFNLKPPFLEKTRFAITAPDDTNKVIEKLIKEKLSNRTVDVQSELNKVNYATNKNSLKHKVKVLGREYELLSFGEDFELYVLQTILNELNGKQKLFGVVCSSYGEFRAINK